MKEHKEDYCEHKIEMSYACPLCGRGGLEYGKSAIISPQEEKTTPSSRVYCEECGEKRTETKDLSGYCAGHLKEHTPPKTTTEGWEKDIRYLTRSIWRHREDDFEGEIDAEAKMIELFRSLLSSERQRWYNLGYKDGQKKKL